MKRFYSIFIIAIFIFTYFWQFFLKGLLPIPSDTIVGLYYPYRDFYSKNYSNGIPFKNFLITDPVRQHFPWKQLAVKQIKRFELPLWNPYSFSGTPLLAGSQSGSLYPLNLIFLYPKFSLAWSFFIMLGPLLGAIFIFRYLSNLGLKKEAGLLGAITFAFSGFFTAWLEWGNVLHTALWLPLILLSVDKLFEKANKKTLSWFAIFIFSLSASFFAGYLQVFFYIFLVTLSYIIFRWIEKKNFILLLKFGISLLLFLAIVSPQLFPFLQFVELSARNIDRANFITQPGWFIPWQNLVQFLIPDFFGNPATLNYWGVWNYGELVGYVGIVPLIMVLGSIFTKRKEVLFFGLILILSLVFALPTLIAKTPFLLKIPFLETSQPTRLLFLTVFSLSILSAIGFDTFISERKKIFAYALIKVAFIFLFIILSLRFLPITADFLIVTKRNILFPALVFLSSGILILSLYFLKKQKKVKVVIWLLILITAFDLFRFSWKFNPFTSGEYLFPQTKTISFLQKNIGSSRVMTLDSRILPPNFSASHGIQFVSGYDPLYIQRYAEYVSALERNKPDISAPYGFNRIVNPANYQNPLTNLLGVKYILSFSELNGNVKMVHEEGKTKTYENLSVLPRTFFVKDILESKDKEDSISKMYKPDYDALSTAVVEKYKANKTNFELGDTKIVNYSENKIEIETENSGEGFLVLTDIYYPSWKAKIKTGSGLRDAQIILTDYTFRGVVVPSGKNTVIFYNTLF